jgi:hypothetical protein
MQQVKLPERIDLMIMEEAWQMRRNQTTMMGQNDRIYDEKHAQPD